MKTRRVTLIFFLLAAFAVAFSLWWAYHIYDLHARILDLKQELAIYEASPGASEAALREYEHAQVMLISEAVAFLMLLLYGLWKIHNGSIKEMKLAARQRNFMLSVTHELKSPLASIKLAMETVIRREIDRQQVKQLASNSIQDAERLSTLVDNILLASRLESGTYRYEFRSTDISALMEQITGQMVSGGAGNIISLIEPGITVTADPVAFASVPLNLIDNALKYGHPACPVHIDLKRSGQLIHLEVADTGPGISASEKLHIFDRFYRVGDEQVRKTKGTGLGLFIVKSVVEGHGWKVEVTDNHHGGTTFKVTIHE